MPYGWYSTLITTSQRSVQLLQHWFSKDNVCQAPAAEVSKDLLDWNIALLEQQAQDDKSNTMVLQALCWFKS